MTDDARESADDLHAAISRLYEDYGRDFSAGDPAAAASHWHAPSIAVSPDGVLVYPSHDDRRERYAAIQDDLRETDYDHSDPVEIRSHRLTRGTAISTIVWHRVTAEGDVLSRFSPFHLLRRTEDGWRFVARSSRSADDAFPMTALEAAAESGADGDGDSVPVRRDVAAFFDRYGRDFSTAEPEAPAAHWNAPTLLLSPERARVVSTRDEAEGVLGRIFDGLREEDYDRSEATEVRVRRLDDGIALADVHWERFDADGTVFDRFAALHLLRETDDGWKLVVISRHPVETVLPLANG